MVDRAQPERITSPSLLLADGPDTIRGYLDSFDPDTGIEGWALNLQDLSLPVRLELMVADSVVAECTTTGPRSDIAAALGQQVTPGFRFPKDSFKKLFRMGPARNQHPIRIRIAGTPLVLLTPMLLPTPAELQRRHRESRAEATPQQFDLLARLSAQRSRAHELTAAPLRLSPELMMGCVEALSIDESGAVWVIGWMSSGGPVDCPVVLFDGEKAPAGFAFTLFPRADLAGVDAGLIGVLFTDWRPAALGEVHLFLGPDGRYLRSTGAMRVIPMAEMTAFVSRELPNCHTGHTKALRRLIERPDNWNIGARGGLAAQASVDRMLVLPGFGALVSGWVISPVRPVQGFAIRLGDAILTCDRNSLYSEARPDLAGIAPGDQALLAGAGFVAAFRGALGVADLSDPVLKVIYADGSSSNHAVESRALKRLDPGSLSSALDLYPSLDSELFFSDLAMALREDASGCTRACRAYAVVPASRALVFVVPEQRSDVFLLFHQIVDHLRPLPDPPSVVLIAGTTRSRPETVSLFRAMRAATPAVCSLFFVDDARYALYLLPQVLNEVQPTGFAFVAAGLFLTEMGWQAATKALETTEPPLRFLEIDEAGAPALGPARSAECFVWSWAAFDDWIDDAPMFLTGFFDDNGLGHADGAVAVPLSARRSHSPKGLPIITAINRMTAGA